MGFSRYALAAFLCAYLLAGCSSVKEELKPVPLKPIEATLRLHQQWSKVAGIGQDARYERLQPAFLKGVLYTADINGRIAAFDAKSGQQIWKNTLGKAVGGGVGVFGELGFVGTLDGYVIAFSLADGAQKWAAKASSEVVSAPQSNGEVVVVSAIDGRVFAFDYTSGERKWNYDHPTPVLSLRSNAAPLVLQNNAFVAFDNGQLLSFDTRSGQLLWTARVGQPQGKTELERLIDSDSAPLEYGPYIYGAGYNSKLVAISRGTGRIAWSQPVSTAQNIVAGADKVVVSDVNSHVKAFDAETGALLWENDLLHRRNIGAPAILGDVAFVVDGKGYVHGLSLADGKLVSRSRLLHGPAVAQPLVIDETVYFYDLQGNLSAHVAKFGKFATSIWSLPTNREKGAIATKYTGVRKTQ